MTKSKINSAIKHTGLKVEGKRGDGYFYFLDAATDYCIPNSSVYVCYLNQLSLAQWVEEAEGVER